MVPLISSPAIPLTPSLNDFLVNIVDPKGTVQTYQLFSLCREYLQEAQLLREKAREIADKVHNGQPLTDPPEF
jgi:hypothetical protein